MKQSKRKIPVRTVNAGKEGREILESLPRADGKGKKVRERVHG